MESVYIVGIVASAVVIIVVIVLLRNRITSAQGTLDIAQKRISGEFEAASPEVEQDRKKTARYTPTPTGIRENIQIGNPIIKVLRRVRVFRNLQIGGGRIEVTEQSDSDREGQAASPSVQRPDSKEESQEE